MGPAISGGARDQPRALPATRSPPAADVQTLAGGWEPSPSGAGQGAEAGSHLVFLGRGASEAPSRLLWKPPLGKRRPSSSLGAWALGMELCRAGQDGPDGTAGPEGEGALSGRIHSPRLSLRLG